VFGNEGDGITQSVLDACDQSAAIPMMNETDSLNVASASAVFLYEARKQRENLAKRKTTSQDLHQSSELNELAV
jgi:tRNA G18 (ribose-2'-O)-methylase SpoU